MATHVKFMKYSLNRTANKYNYEKQTLPVDVIQYRYKYWDIM